MNTARSCPACGGTGGTTSSCGTCRGTGMGIVVVREPRTITRRQMIVGRIAWIVVGAVMGVICGAFSAVIMLIPSGTLYNPIDDLAQTPSDPNRFRFRELLFLCGGLGMVCGAVTTVIVWFNGSGYHPLVWGFSVSAAIGALMGSWLGVVWGLGRWRTTIE